MEDVTGEVPRLATAAVLEVKCEPMPEGSQPIKGYDFNEGIDYERLLDTYKQIGFQASNYGLAVDEINRMISWRLSDEPVEGETDESYLDPEVRKKTKCTIWLSYTSNMISCGVREVIRYLVEHNMVDVLCTTAGGIEEDFMKCMMPHYVGDFALRGQDLRMKGHNRIGNMIVPNDNYCRFEEWFQPLLDEMLAEQVDQGKIWTPSSMIKLMGERIDNTDSVYYWAAKNDIPVFCPAITDGSVGDMLFFHSYKNNPSLIVDIARDIRAINDIALSAKKSGMLILGGGLCKHHVCNANLMRNGADYSVFINTGQEFDGSDSGARPDEAVSWGKIRLEANPVKVYGDASFIFPLVVAKTFAKAIEAKKAEDAAAAAAAPAPAPEGEAAA